MFKLALALGMTVAELGQRMSSAELTEWALYFELEPPGRDDEWRTGLLASTFANVFRGEDKRPLKAEDFMRPWFVPEDEREEPEDKGKRLAAQINTIMYALGGREVKCGDTEQAGSQAGA